MALLAEGSHQLPPLSFEPGTRFEDSAHFKAYAELQERSAAVDLSGSLVGCLLSWPAADGYAVYVVTNDEPLTVQHVKWLDGWNVDRVLIKGLDRDDVIEHVELQRRRDAFFKKPRS